MAVWDDGLNAPRAESALGTVADRSRRVPCRDQHVGVQNHRDVTIANRGATSLAGIEGRLVVVILVLNKGPLTIKRMLTLGIRVPGHIFLCQGL